MKTITTIAFLLVFGFNSQAQFAWYLSAGPTIGGSKSDHLTSFFQSYNSYYDAQKDEGFSESISPAGFTLISGVAMGDGVFEAGLGLGKAYGRNTFTYKNGDKRTLKFNQSDFIVDATFGTNNESPVHFHINLGMTFRSANTQLFYEYSDGTKYYNQQSYGAGGTDKMNGLYNSWRLSYFAGASAGINLDEYGKKLFVRADYYFKASEAFWGSYWDKQYAKDRISSGTTTNLPLNVDTYYNDAIGNIFNEVENDTYGIRITLTLSIPIITD